MHEHTVPASMEEASNPKRAPLGVQKKLRAALL